jgi:hypothetical protein
MLKISQIESGDRQVILRLEGRIAGPWVAEMRKACERFLDDGRQLKLNLADVVYADQNGISALANLKSRGVLLADCSPFLTEQLKAVSAG